MTAHKQQASPTTYLYVIICLGVLASTILGACSSSQESSTFIEDIQIEMMTEPNPPTVGESTLLITVLNTEGVPIDGATVRVHGNMDHEGMEPVTGESTESENGVHSMPFIWTMGGWWILDVTVELADDQGVTQTEFTLDVGAISSGSIINQTSNMANMGHDDMSDMEETEEPGK